VPQGNHVGCGGKNAFFAPFYTVKRSFKTKTGSGHT
jgi:hypothetical protein